MLSWLSYLTSPYPLTDGRYTHVTHLKNIANRIKIKDTSKINYACIDVGLQCHV